MPEREEALLSVSVRRSMELLQTTAVPGSGELIESSAKAPAHSETAKQLTVVAVRLFVAAAVAERGGAGRTAGELTAVALVPVAAEPQCPCVSFQLMHRQEPVGC